MTMSRETEAPTTRPLSVRNSRAAPASRSATRRADNPPHGSVDSMPGFVFRRSLAPDGTVSYPYVSPNMREWFGVGPLNGGPARRLFRDYLHPQDRQLFDDAMDLSAKDLSPVEVSVRLGTAKNPAKWLRIVSSPRKLIGGGVQWDCVALDIAEAKSWEARLSHHDPLTGLPNRALLVNWLNHALKRAKRLKSPAFVIALELMSLSQIRESSGFDTGDACIRETAVRIQKAMLFADTIAYTGGGGFLIVVVQVDKKSDFVAPLRALKQQFAERVTLDGQSYPLTISMGVSVVPGDGDTAEALIGNATTALNRAKANTDHPYQFYNPKMTERAVVRLSVDSELSRALERNELKLFYQPQHDARGLDIVGVEALMRWQHPQRGLVLPGKFISVAEESGLIVALGDFALCEACTQARDWHDRGVTSVPVSVNISGVQLGQPGLADRVLRILSDTGLPPNRLKLEITETSIVRNADVAARTMVKLTDAGVEFSVDDFGIEHSALSLLSRLPIRSLKIDYSFVSRMTNCRVHAALVQAIVSMAHAMGMNVVAEGVETEAQLTYLQAYHCDVLQGFLLNRPMPPRKLEATVKRQSLRPAGATR